MSGNDIKVFVVDDHTLFRRGLIGIISDMPGFRVVGEAGNGLEALKMLPTVLADILLVDIHMPEMNGIEMVKAIRKLGKPIRIVMLTISKNDEDLFGAIKAGADGYLLKNTDPDDLQKALIQLSKGAGILSPEVTQAVLKTVSNLTGRDDTGGMSQREMDVLYCLANGQTTREISSSLFISENTIKTHIRHIMEKLEASNRTEAVSKALQMGLIRRTER